MSISEWTYMRMGLCSRHVRFVDRDMFMRYRGGGIGHKYMREVELKYENMSIKRSHTKSCTNPSNNSAYDDAVMSGLTGPDPVQPGRSQEGSSMSVGGLNWGESDSDDEDYFPPAGGGSSNDDGWTDSSDYSDDDDSSVDFEADFDEVGSDDGYDSYGMAAP
jgi:hypothetical protein